MPTAPLDRPRLHHQDQPSEWQEDPSQPTRNSEEPSFATRLFFTDLSAIVVAVYGSQLLRFGTNVVELKIPRARVQDYTVSYSLV
ncbi:MAG: hypothetical protein NTV19_00190, partial [Burkholderiales bacterium]|nr:hypothetical protein [Burkholderiales bacterium]